MQRESPMKATPSGKIKQFCTFRLAGRRYGVDILDVKEVNQEAAFTKIYHAPKEVMGYVNIRGRIHLILNLRRILGMRGAQVDGKSRLVLFKPNVGESFGVLVDAVSDVVETDESLIESGSIVNEELGTDERNEAVDLITGVCRLKDSLLLIINARNLLKIVDKAKN